MFKGRQYCIVAGTLTLTMTTGVWSHEHFDVKLIKHGATFHDSKIHGAELSGALVAGLSRAAGGAGDDIKVSGALEDVSVVQQGATWSPNEVTGQIDMQTTSQGNRCLYDPLGAIRSLRQRGDITGFNRPPDGFGVGYPNPKDDTWHWQGVQRLSPVLRGKGQVDASAARYMIVSSSQPYFDADKPEITGPHFAVVYMGSRDQDGLRWRSP